MRRAGKIGLGVLLAAVALLVFLYWPVSAPTAPSAAPAQDYAQAMERIAASSDHQLILYIICTA